MYLTFVFNICRVLPIYFDRMGEILVFLYYRSLWFLFSFLRAILLIWRCVGRGQSLFLRHYIIQVIILGRYECFSSYVTVFRIEC